MTWDCISDGFYMQDITIKDLHSVYYIIYYVYKYENNCVFYSTNLQFIWYFKTCNFNDKKVGSLFLNKIF